MAVQKSEIKDHQQSFYIRNNISRLDEDGILDIEMSLDACFSVRGHESTYCMSSVIDCWSNRIIDIEITVKCVYVWV